MKILHAIFFFGGFLYWCDDDLDIAGERGGQCGAGWWLSVSWLPCSSWPTTSMSFSPASPSQHCNPPLRTLRTSTSPLSPSVTGTRSGRDCSIHSTRQCGLECKTNYIFFAETPGGRILAYQERQTWQGRKLSATSILEQRSSRITSRWLNWWGLTKSKRSSAAIWSTQVSFPVENHCYCYILFYFRTVPQVWEGQARI